MSTFTERLYRITRRHPQLSSKAKLALHLGVSRSMVNNYENSTPDPPREILDKVTALEVSLGIDDSTDEKKNRHPAIASKLGIRKVPLVGMAHAGTAVAYDELPCEADDYITTDCPDEKAFALKLEGDSMEPKYSAPDVLVLTPSTPPYSGCMAVVKFNEDQGVLFRRVEFFPEGVKLVAFNKDYESRMYPRESFCWIYPVFERKTRLLR